MTPDEQKVFQEKIFTDRFEIIQKSNDVLLAYLNKAWKQAASMTPEDFDSISKVATVRYHFYAELMDAFDRQLLLGSQSPQTENLQNAYVLHDKGGTA